MEGVRVFSPDDWEASGIDSTSYAAEDLKKCLEGLARHLFGKLLNEHLVEQMRTLESVVSTVYNLVTTKDAELGKQRMNLKGKKQLILGGKKNQHKFVLWS